MLQKRLSIDKNRKVQTRAIGQINFYLEALDRDIKKLRENLSVGVILCARKDDAVVEYVRSVVVYLQCWFRTAHFIFQTKIFCGISCKNWQTWCWKTVSRMRISYCLGINAVC